MIQNKEEKLFYAVFMIAAVVLADSAYGSTATVPANLSPRGVAEWAIIGGHVSSGTGALPAVGSEGSRYVDLSTPTAPLEYLSVGGVWRAISGTGGGTTDHSALSNLDYAGSGHTGFAASTDIPNNASFTLADLSEKNFGSLTDTPTTIAGYGLTDAASTTALTDHTNDTSDPHGADMIVSGSITVGSGVGDAYTYRVATGVVGIASYACIIPQAATPSATIATGTLWYDSNVNKLKCYDGSVWNDLW